MRGSGGVLTRRPAGRSPARCGFTLAEILIVVIILGILAAIVLPQYKDVQRQACATNLAENLSKIRAHIQVYRNQHAGYPPGADFADQLTKATDFHGDVSATRDATHHYGPYIEQMPANPVTGSRAIRVATTAAEMFTVPAADAGWWYNEVRGEFRADLTDAEEDTEGRAFNQY
jgi:prepilin-type N-terminal cleavage/methylation domain-containing protein